MTSILDVCESFLKVLEEEVREKAKECDHLQDQWTGEGCDAAACAHAEALLVHAWLERVVLGMQEIYDHQMIMDL